MNVNDLIDVIDNVQTACTKVKGLKNPYGIEMVYFHNKNMHWDKAAEYADKCNVLGYDDWRLPNTKEIQWIFKHMIERFECFDGLNYKNRIRVWSNEARSDEKLAWAVDSKCVKFLYEKNEYKYFAFYVR